MKGLGRIRGRLANRRPATVALCAAVSLLMVGGAASLGLRVAPFLRLGGGDRTSLDYAAPNQAFPRLRSDYIRDVLGGLFPDLAAPADARGHSSASSASVGFLTPAASDQVSPPGAEACAQGQSVTELAQPVNVLNAGCAQPDTTSDPVIAANPTDPLNAVSVFQEGRDYWLSSRGLGFATTLDGGRTWTSGNLPFTVYTTAGCGTVNPPPGCERLDAKDPTVTFDSNGVAYAAGHMGDRDGSGNRSVLVSRSTDKGRTWSAPTVIFDAGADRPVLAGDTSGRHPGRVYLVYMSPWGPNTSATATEGGCSGCVTWGLLSATFTDDGQHWGDCYDPSAPSPGSALPPPLAYNTTWTRCDLAHRVGLLPTDSVVAYPTAALVLPDGGLAVVWYDITGPVFGSSRKPPLNRANVTARIEMAVARESPTGALVFGPRTVVASMDSPPLQQVRDFPGPYAALDPTTGRIVVVWPDSRYRSDGVNDIVETTSTDQGLTWSPVIRVNPGPRFPALASDHVQHWNATAVISASHHIGVAYRQRDESVDANGNQISYHVDTYYQQSDDGLAFTPPLAVSTVPSDLRFSITVDGSMLLDDPDPYACGQPNPQPPPCLPPPVETYPVAYLGDYQGMAAVGDTIYISRSEPVRLSFDEPATFPPSHHHQFVVVSTVNARAVADMAGS